MILTDRDLHGRHTFLQAMRRLRYARVYKREFYMKGSMAPAQERLDIYMKTRGEWQLADMEFQYTPQQVRRRDATCLRLQAKVAPQMGDVAWVCTAYRFGDMRDLYLDILYTGTT